MVDMFSIREEKTHNIYRTSEAWNRLSCTELASQALVTGSHLLLKYCQSYSSRKYTTKSYSVRLNESENLVCRLVSVGTGDLRFTLNYGIIYLVSCGTAGFRNFIIFLSYVIKPNLWTCLTTITQNAVINIDSWYHSWKLSAHRQQQQMFPKHPWTCWTKGWRNWHEWL